MEASSNTPAKPTAASSITKVRVIVRVRPFLAPEIAQNANPKPCISVMETDVESCEEVTVQLKDPDTIRKECYQLDSFFGVEDDNVGKIYQKEVKPMIPGIFQGCNATVFAYGATGSGKTYTMQGSEETPGIMPLAMSTILSMCQSTGSTVEISYYEVYMDRCYDLLEVKANEIAILDDKDGQIHLKGLSRVPINSMTEFQEVYSRGIQRRKVAHTGLNDVSSRSHGVLVIVIFGPVDDTSGVALIGKLNLIDLAGNEDNRRTCNEGIRLQESAKINQSLFALSNVIYALNNKLRIPYRETKLTRILQDSLGGTSRSLMIACLNPGEYQESVRTVSLAARSRHITNCVPSAQKSSTPMVQKIDMEAKLQAWLESKGKTKSTRSRVPFISPTVGKTPNSVNSMKKSKYNGSTKSKNASNLNASITKQRSLCEPFNKLSTRDDSVDSWLEDMNHPSLDNLNKSTGYMPGDPSEEKTLSSSVQSSPICERITAAKSPLRKALSPINSVDLTHKEELSFNIQFGRSLFEATTPKTPFIGPCLANKIQPNCTPLHRFGANSSNLKNFFEHEYIDLLNSASREELLEIKGIGQKLADYICELRETSPIRKLSDLEKIGLSSKQVHNLLNKAAQKIFNRPESATPSCLKI